ncbi:hypothetical protein BKA66DRAFT_444196 [Pyrenochaeta sp. MPI-SDFR-AT-0127]|nr:hypothetical protein BKA66DRAFT_444196 [Pyrenochaeta sp. MPI-SDFR-AT-0127]
MDPLSAVLAFTGFSASLLTIVDAIAKVSSTLVELQKKFKNAPKKIKQLHHDLQNLQALVIAIQARICSVKTIDYPPSLQELCGSLAVQLEQTLEELNAVASRIESKSVTPDSKAYRARTKHVLAETTIDDFLRRISTHFGYLIMVQTLINKPNRQRRRNLPVVDSEESDEQGAIKKHFPTGSFRERKTYDFGFGLLSIQAVRIRTTSQELLNKNSDCVRLNVSFVPPSWMSRTALQASIDFHPLCNNGPSISLTPTTVNQSPELLKAIYHFDLPRIQYLFETDQARPSDMVIDLIMSEPVPLAEASLRIATTKTSVLLAKFGRHYYTSGAAMLSDGSRDIAIFNMLTGNREEAAILFFLNMDSRWAYDRPQMLPRAAQRYLDRLLDHTEVCFDTFSFPSEHFVKPGWSSYRFGICGDKFEESILPTLVEGVFGFEAIRSCLFHEAQSWTLEDFSGRGRWYVAVLAHYDQSFRQALQTYARSFRSIMDASHDHPIDTLLASILDISIIVSEVEKASVKERFLFMRTLSSKGKAVMLAPFLEANINLNEGIGADNYLGAAAKAENLETFEMLLHAGASTARAISTFCCTQKPDSRIFRGLFSRLVDGLKPGMSQSLQCGWDDPLLAILRNTQVLDVRADAPEILFKNKIFSASHLYGSDTIYPINSHMFLAISNNCTAILKLLLEHKPPMDLTITNMFATDRDHFQSIIDYTWLTLAVELGRSECVKLILANIENQAQAIICSDGAGRTALQIAQAAVKTCHPRKSVLNGLHWIDNQSDTLVSAMEDDATLLILQAASSTNTATDHPIKDFMQGSDLKAKICHLPFSWSPFIAKIHDQFDSIQSGAIHRIIKLFHFSPKGFSYFDIVLSCPNSGCSTCGRSQAEAIVKKQLEQLTRMTFLEALIVRLCYVTMIGLIMTYELATLAVGLRGLEKLSRPSRAITCLALFVVAWISRTQVAV